MDTEKQNDITPSASPPEPPAETNKSEESFDVGGKVFFLYPTNSIVNQIINELIQNEYEAYVAKDHSRLTYVLKKYPDCVIFINIDEKIAHSEWEKWINAVFSASQDIKIGVFSSNTDEEYREKFIKNNRITCGFQTLKVDMTKSIDVILEMLRVMNVKGRRKYLRASMEHESNVTINIPYGGNFLNGVIKDMSVVGFSCVFDQDPNLAKKTLLKDIQIKLQSMLLNVDAVVYGSRLHSTGEKTYVMIFTQRVDSDVRVKIRKYIQKIIQQKMDSEIN